MKTLISVVVCTYNRSRLLHHCLQSLAAQTLSDERYEVLVVDNNSSDTTFQVATRFAEKCSHFKVIVEPEQGLSHARNRGWNEAKGHFVAYIDDDARAHDDWLSQMTAFIERHPEVEAFGGPYDAFSDAEMPEWFPPEYGSWSLGNQERKISVGEEFISGTNMVFRKSLLRSVGGFEVSLGMAGERVSYGEETRFLIELAERGIPVYYSPNMKVDHLVSEYKLSLRWLLYSSYENGRCSRETLNIKRPLCSHLLGLGIGFAKMVSAMTRFGDVPNKRRIYYAMNGLWWELGAFIGFFSHEKS